MKDIAKAAGVAHSTVSRILNDAPLLVPVSRESRERVLAAAAELAYRPNPHARGLRGASTMLLGAIVRNMTDPFFAVAIDALSTEARKLGYSVVLGHAREQADEALALAAVLEARQCDAIVIVGDMRSQPRLIEDLKRVRVPVVALWHGSRYDSFASVHVDNRYGIEAALDHLTGLGHTRIAFVGDPVLGDIQERQAACEDYFARGGRDIPEGYIEHVQNSTSGGAAAFETLMELAERPTAVAAATDVLAMGVLHAAFERGLVVPADFSVVGFDDIPLAATTVPALTTVRMPVGKMIEAAVELAVDGKQGKADSAGGRARLPPLARRSAPDRKARMTIAITGGSGKAGGTILRDLLERGHDWSTSTAPRRRSRDSPDSHAHGVRRRSAARRQTP
jgi:DNA-binding LacI/PurR family transcriptional regulator